MSFPTTPTPAAIAALPDQRKEVTDAQNEEPTMSVLPADLAEDEFIHSDAGVELECANAECPSYGLTWSSGIEHGEGLSAPTAAECPDCHEEGIEHE